MSKYDKAAYEAVHLSGWRWAVRPKGKLGTIGWTPFHWEVIYVSATTYDKAIDKAMKELLK